jgi:hypothetical protein
MSLKIRDKLADKANQFPESSYGATTVTLILSDGRLIDDVILGGASHIVKVGDRFLSDAGDLNFSLSEIVDVAPKVAGLSRMILLLKVFILKRTSRNGLVMSVRVARWERLAPVSKFNLE